MATITQPSEDGISPARAFWDGMMEKHPTIRGVLSIIGSIFGFFFNGHFIVAFGHWVILFSGRIAETALLFATLWVTGENVAPSLLIKLGQDNVNSLNSLSLMTFSLLPEVILFSAIITTYQHWNAARTDWRSGRWIWAALYSLPTGTFFIMTVVTISSFVTSESTTVAAAASATATIHATGWTLVVRCLGGWFYALIELIYSMIGRPKHAVVQPQQIVTIVERVEAQLQAAVANTKATLDTQVANVVASAKTAISDQSRQVVANLATTTRTVIREQVEGVVANLPAIASSQIAEVVANEVASFRAEITEHLGSQVATLVANAYIPTPSSPDEGLNAQVATLVAILNEQQQTIQQLTRALSDVRKEVRTTVTEIREIRSEALVLPAPPTQPRLPAPTSQAVVEADESEKGTAIRAFLKQWHDRGETRRPPLQRIQDECKVAKRTAAKYRDEFYLSSQFGSQSEEEEDG